MERHPVNIIIALAVILAVAFIVGCGSDVKPPKYPGQEKALGEAKEEGGEFSKSSPSKPGGQGSEGGSAVAMPPPDIDPSGEGKSAIAPVAPFGAEPVARPLQADEEEVESSEDEESSSEVTEETGDDEVEEVAVTEPADEGTPERKKKPSYYSQLGSDFAFEYNDPGQGKVGEFNEMLAAIDILTVNEEKYEYAAAYLTEEAEGFSRGDPLFIPEAVPDELRPLIPGEGIQGALDQELLELLKSQVQADLRSIPIWITGVMEQGGTKLAIGTIRGSLKFKVSQGQEIRLWYSGWYLLGITGAHISEDLVVLNLRLLQFTGRGFIPVTDPVPRSFHIGIT